MIFNEIAKNLKLVLRNWTSLSLLVLGPMILMLILGLTTGGENPHDIFIGIHSSDQRAAQGIISQVSTIGQAVSYLSIEECITDMTHGATHLCIAITEENSLTYPRGVFSFYTDSSRRKISDALIQRIRELMGETSEGISIQSTRSILEQIQEMVASLRERQTDIQSFITESQHMRDALTTRGQRLQQIKSEFLPIHSQILQIHNETLQATELLNTSLETLSGLISTLNSSVDVLATPNNVTPAFPQLNMTHLVGNESNTSILNLSAIVNPPRLDQQTVELNHLITQLANTTQSLTNLATHLPLEQINRQVQEIVNIESQLNAWIDEEIAFNDLALKKIDAAVVRITQINDDLEEGMKKFEALDPSLAEKIIRPTLSEYKPIKDVKPIHASFSGVLVLVILFLSIIFANILALGEIHSDAFFRNIISPGSKMMYPLGLFFTNIILATIQISILLLVAKFRFGISLFEYPAQLYLLCIALISLFTLVGMAVAYLVKNENTSILTTIFVSLGFYLFSVITTPLELMPKISAFIAALNPVTIGEELARELLVYGTPIYRSSLGLLFCYLITAFFFVLWLNYRFIVKKR